MSGHGIPRWFTNFARFGDHPVTFDPSRDPNYNAQDALVEDVQAHLRGKEVLRPETPRLPLRVVPLTEGLALPPNVPEESSPATKDTALGRVEDYLNYWDVWAAEIQAENNELDACEPTCPPECDTDVICGEYKNGYHVLRQSDLRELIAELRAARHKNT